MTYNTLTLLDPTSNRKARSYTGKQAILDHQRHIAGVHIAGFQETRIKAGHASSTATKHYHIATAEATACGTGGIQIWVSTDLFHHLQIVHANPRLLEATAAPTNATPPLIIAAHAPHSCDSTQTLDEWWQRLTAITAKQPQHLLRDAIVLIDANAQINDTHGKTGETSQRLHDYITRFGLAPAKSDTIKHDGPQYTWTGPRNAERTIDHILIPIHHAAGVTATHTRTDFDIGHSHHDHLPFTADITIRTSKHTGT